MFKTLAAIILFSWLGLIWPGRAPAEGALPLAVAASRPHDARLYTQGLFFHGDCLYESSGLYGRSAFLRQSFPGRAVLAARRLPAEYFAEGAALAEGEIYLLTWRENTALVLDPETLAVKRRPQYEGEGWGLAFDGHRLWRSDGSAYLYPHRPGDFSPAGDPLRVLSGGRPVDRLNELEWDPFRKVILANVYGSDHVAVISPADGRVLHWLDGRPLRALAEKAGLKSGVGVDGFDTVLNGLALAPDGRSLWLTGKLWPAMYQVVWPPDNMKIDDNP